MNDDRTLTPERLAAWVGVGLVFWAILLGVVWVTAKFIQHLF